MGKSNLVDIVCKVVRNDESSSSIVVTDGTTVPNDRGGERPKWFWLPRSQVTINPDGTVTMPDWLAYDRGLI